MTRSQLVGLTLVVIGSAALRLLFNHFSVWNFSPLVAVSLFAGVRFSDKKLAFLVPFAVMLLTDWIIGFHAQMLPVYLSYAMIVGLGIVLSRKESVVKTVGMSLVSSVLFFLVTNMTFWYTNISLYPNTLSGQIASYTAAVPFFGNALVGDLMFTVLTFGGWYLVTGVKPKLVKAAV